MKSELLKLLICPFCARPFQLTALEQEGGEVKEGLLSCSCGREYPVTGFIPRILEATDLKGLKKKTQSSFGYQWTSFHQMSCDFRENFLNYIYPVSAEFFRGKLGLDSGCGFGRHIFQAAGFGAKMVGIDFSRAIESTRRNTLGMDNVYLAQADIYKLPFAPGSFDFVYSIGVLHHLPDPEAGFRALVKLVRPGGSLFIWVYSSRRKWAVKIIELVRKITTRMPYRPLKALCFLVALLDYALLILPFKLLRKNRRIANSLEKIFPRSFLYAGYPFQVTFADWFDRLAAPIRFYYDGKDMQAWLECVGLVNIKVSPTGLYGWRAYGEKKG